MYGQYDQKYSDKWGRNFPSCFKGDGYSQHKGEDIRRLERLIENLEKNTNDLKKNLGSAGKYLLEKLVKKQNKLLQNNENSNKLEEIKQALREELNTNQESLQILLDKQKELFNLEKTFGKFTK